MGTITSGVDLAKSVFPVGDAGGAGHVAQRQDLQREAFARWLAQRPVVNIVPDASSLRLEGPRRKPDAPGLTGRPPTERLGASRIPGATIDSRLPQSMGTTMARFVIEPHVAIALAAANAEIPKQHKLFAPTLLRSQVLALLFAEVHAGRLTRAEASRLLDYLRGVAHQAAGRQGSAACGLGYRPAAGLERHLCSRVPGFDKAAMRCACDRRARTCRFGPANRCGSANARLAGLRSPGDANRLMLDGLDQCGKRRKMLGDGLFDRQHGRGDAGDIAADHSVERGTFGRVHQCGHDAANKAQHKAAKSTVDHTAPRDAPPDGQGFSPRNIHDFPCAQRQADPGSGSARAMLRAVRSAVKRLDP